MGVKGLNNQPIQTQQAQRSQAPNSDTSRRTGHLSAGGNTLSVALSRDPNTMRAPTRRNMGPAPRYNPNAPSTPPSKRQETGTKVPRLRIPQNMERMSSGHGALRTMAAFFSSMGTIAGSGAAGFAIGMAAGGPLGAAIGTGVGVMAGMVFSVAFGADAAERAVDKLFSDTNQMMSNGIEVLKEAGVQYTSKDQERLGGNGGAGQPGLSNDQWRAVLTMDKRQEGGKMSSVERNMVRAAIVHSVAKADTNGLAAAGAAKRKLLEAFNTGGSEALKQAFDEVVNLRDSAPIAKREQNEMPHSPGIPPRKPSQFSDDTNSGKYMDALQNGDTSSIHVKHVEYSMARIRGAENTYFLRDMADLHNAPLDTPDDIQKFKTALKSIRDQFFDNSSSMVLNLGRGGAALTDAQEKFGMFEQGQTSDQFIDNMSVDDLNQFRRGHNDSENPLSEAVTRAKWFVNKGLSDAAVMDGNQAPEQSGDGSSVQLDPEHRMRMGNSLNTEVLNNLGLTPDVLDLKVSNDMYLDETPLKDFIQMAVSDQAENFTGDPNSDDDARAALKVAVSDAIAQATKPGNTPEVKLAEALDAVRAKL